MKAITNWRYYVMAALFTIGFLCIAFAFGEDERPLGQWITTHLSLFFIGMGLFSILGRCVKRWEARGEIPEFTNQSKTL